MVRQWLSEKTFKLIPDLKKKKKNKKKIRSVLAQKIARGLNLVDELCYLAEIRALIYSLFWSN